MCKPQKKGWAKKLELGHRGFGKLRKEESARADLKDGVREYDEDVLWTD